MKSAGAIGISVDCGISGWVKLFLGPLIKYMSVKYLLCARLCFGLGDPVGDKVDKGPLPWRVDVPGRETENHKKISRWGSFSQKQALEENLTF